MGAPIPLPNIQLKVFNPDVSKYHANRLARIRAIGERAQQKKLREEAQQRILAKEFNDINVEKQKFTTEYFHQQQAEMISDFNRKMAGEQARDGKAFSHGTLLAAQREAARIDNAIDNMAFSEAAYKEDGEFVSKNMKYVDSDFREAYEGYNPRKHGLYNDYLRKNKTKASLRSMSGVEVTSEMNKDYYKGDKLDERIETSLRKNGDTEKDATKYLAQAYHVNPEGEITGANTKWQFGEYSDILNSNLKWEIGLKSEYDNLKDENQKKFYENLAAHDTDNYKGYYDTDFTDVNDPSAPGDKDDAWQYYGFDKYGSDLYAFNKDIQITDAAIKKAKEKIKTRGGYTLTKNNDINIGSVDPTISTYKSGVSTEKYYQLGPISKRRQTGNLIGVIDVSGEGDKTKETLNASDYQSYDLIGFDLGYGENPMAHIVVSLKDAPLYKDGVPVYERIEGMSGTHEEIENKIKNSSLKRKKKNKKLERVNNLIESTGDERIRRTTRKKDMLIPINRNKGVFDGYYIDPELINDSVTYDETTETQITSFMSNNGIKDRNEAIKILKSKGIIK